MRALAIALKTDIYVNTK